MKKSVICVAVFAVLASLSYAQEEVKSSKEYVPLAKGNFWEYKVKTEGKEIDGKLEVVEELGQGRFELKAVNIGIEDPLTKDKTVQINIGGEYLLWKEKESSGFFTVQMLKFGVKKGDSWTSTVAIEGKEGSEEVNLSSSMVAIEEVSTPAGVFKNCLKVAHEIRKGKKQSPFLWVWFAKDVGIVKLQIEGGPDPILWSLVKHNLTPTLDEKELSGWLKDCENALLIEITSVTDIKPEKEGEPVTSVKVAAKVEKALKGESSEKELTLEMPAGTIKQGKYVLFFKKSEKGNAIVGDPVPATEENLKTIEKSLTPPPKGK